MTLRITGDIGSNPALRTVEFEARAAGFHVPFVARPGGAPLVLRPGAFAETLADPSAALAHSYPA